MSRDFQIDRDERPHATILLAQEIQVDVYAKSDAGQGLVVVVEYSNWRRENTAA
jgi:hypothetical protein